MNAILKEDPPDLSRATKLTISPALERVIRRCLQKSREERFHSARDVHSALEGVSAPSSTSSGGAVVESARPRNWVPMLAVGLAGLALVGMLADVLGSRRLKQEAPSYQHVTFDSGRAGPARFTRNGNTLAYQRPGMAAKSNSICNELQELSRKPLVSTLT